MTALSLAWITFGADVLHFAFNQSLALPLQALSLVIGCFQIADGLQIVLTGVLRGFGDTKSALWANALGHWVVGLPLAYTLGVYKQMGLWLGLAVGFWVVAAFLIFRWVGITRSQSGSSSKNHFFGMKTGMVMYE